MTIDQKPVEILLIEDNPADVELTLRALERQKLVNKVRVITDGAEALEFIFHTGRYAGKDINNRPKVILLDLKLPKVDGLEILRRVKADAEAKTIPVVVLTSSKEETDLAKSYKLGANSYIIKPVDFDKFVTTVSELGLYWVLLNEAPR